VPSLCAVALSAVFAAESSVWRFNPMTNNFSAAVLASWRKSINRAFEAIKNMGLTGHNNVKCVFISVSTIFAFFHS
jgi:hypothetical protein